jgi:Pro-kumamolisin, activation domain/Bacterial Ig-like domain (group 3)
MGSQQAQAQTPTTTHDHQVSLPSGPSVALALHTPQKVLDGTALRVGHYNPEQKLRLALAVQPPHMDEEEKFIKELTTKGSPNFHKFLTQEQWNARFAPAAEDEQKVVDWAESQGLTITHRYPNRLLVDVEGPASVIEKAFGVTMNRYKVGDEEDFSNDRDPAIPQSLSGILHAVLGLNSVETAHRLGSHKAIPKGPDYVAGPAISKAFSGHGDGDPTKAPANRADERMSNPTPKDSYPLNGGVADPRNIQSSEAYNYNALQRFSHCCNEPGDTNSPPESSIALVGYGNYNYSDATTFFNNYGMAWNLSAYYINGSGFPAVDGEAPLDVEYSGAMSNSYGSYHDTAQVIEYEMPNGLYATYADTFNDIVSNDYAKVVSTSYGWEENVGFSGSQATGTMHPIFNNMVGTGWTLIAASGDNGASDGCGASTAIDYPSSDPDFIAAGGTQLSLDSSTGEYVSELGWQGESGSGSCGSNHGGSTGGVSVLFAAPWWQNTGLTNSTYTKGVSYSYYEWVGGTEYIVSNNGNRVVPDISLTANPDVMGEWYYSGGSWQDEGGTSIVAPELAGFFAQENSYLDYVGNICGSGTSACSPVGLASPFIYEDAISGAPHNPFYDITGGWDGSGGCNNNDVTAADSLVYYCTYTGFDLVTGWGSANMLQLAWGINWELIPAYGNPSLAFSGPSINTWYNSDQEVSWTLSDAGSGSYPAPGVAGFTQGWDSIPADPQSEPGGGDGNSFYSGPQYAFASTGCLSFNGAGGCAGGPQGCHTAQVEGWDNEGRTTFGSYGPVCVDTVVPTITDGTSPVTSGTTWVNHSVTVTLYPVDPGTGASGVYRTYYGAPNATNCYPGSLGPCNVYSGPFTISGQQQTFIYYFTEDNAGNFSAEPYQWISIDTTPPSTSPSLSGTIYTGSEYENTVQVTLSASDTGGSGVAHTYYQLDGGGTVTYAGAFNVITLGSHTVKYWSVDAAGNTESSHTTTFSIASTTTATVSATPNPSALGQSVTMTAIVTATEGGTPTGSVTFWNGATNLGSGTLNGSGHATLSTASLPQGALTLQVSYLGAGSDLPTNSVPYNQTVSGPAQLSSPVQAATLTGSSETFTWNAPAGATAYQLWIGSTGVNSNNLYSSGVISSTSATPATLPLNGSTVYGRLYTEINGIWLHQDYTFTAAAPAVITAPTLHATLPGPYTTFTWSAPAGAAGYQLWLGTTGVNSQNLFSSGIMHVNSTLRTNMPTNGETVYARLYTDYNGTWVHADYTFTSAKQSAPVAPAASGTLSGPTETFSWTAATGSSANAYQFWLGSTGVGSNNLVSSGVIYTTSTTRNNLPTNGETLYARLYTDYDGVWVHEDYTLTAAKAAVLTSPAPSGTLTGSSEPFTWSAGTGASDYQLWIGSTGVGSQNLFSSGAVTATTVTPTGLPTNGATLNVRLFTELGGVWVHTDYTVTAE